MELLCVYGYSLGIYVPVSILWVIQISWFQWILVLLGAAMSGFVLLSTVSPVLKGRLIFIVLDFIRFTRLLSLLFLHYSYFYFITIKSFIYEAVLCSLKVLITPHPFQKEDSL